MRTICRVDQVAKPVWQVRKPAMHVGGDSAVFPKHAHNHVACFNDNHKPLVCEIKGESTPYTAMKCSDDQLIGSSFSRSYRGRIETLQRCSTNGGQQKAGVQPYTMGTQHTYSLRREPAPTNENLVPSMAGILTAVSPFRTTKNLHVLPRRVGSHPTERLEQTSRTSLYQVADTPENSAN